MDTIIPRHETMNPRDGKMRTRQRPTSRNGTSPSLRQSTTVRSIRKVFNCIADDSALVAGIKKNTRNGIKRWVENGQIRLFVPLHALSALQARRDGGKSRHADDIRESLKWLDEATTKYPDSVILQGPEETFERWAEVQRFSVPRTLFSEYNHDNEVDSTGTKPTSTDDERKALASSDDSEGSRSLSPTSLDSLQSSLSAMSPPSSPTKKPLPMQNIAHVTSPDRSSLSANVSVPNDLQPLFNYILWRVHQESDPAAALESFIFLCNDDYKMHFAKGFDIRTKRLEQLREAVGREDREFKNRQSLLERENQAAKSENVEPAAPVIDGGDDGEDEVVFKPAIPPTAPAAMLGKPKSTVMDPNAFGRATTVPATTAQDVINGATKSPRAHVSVPRSSPRGGHALPFMPRTGNARGGNPARGTSRGAATRGGRGAFTGSPRGGLSSLNDTVNENTAVMSAEQIDPDSFSRRGNGGFGGSRGGRKLWVPT